MPRSSCPLGEGPGDTKRDTNATGDLAESDWATKRNINVRLYDAVKDGRADVAACLFQAGAKLKAIHFKETPPDRVVDILEALSPLTPSGEDLWSCCPGLVPVLARNPEALDWLLAHGADINEPPNNQSLSKNLTCGVLNDAAEQGDVEFFDYLVSRGADPARSMALREASACRDHDKAVAMLQHLLSNYQLDPNDSDIGGRFKPHDFSMESGRPAAGAIWLKNTAALRVLLEHGADVGNVLNDTYNIWAAGGSTYVSKFTPNIVKLLHEYGADPDDCAHYAIAAGIKDCVVMAFEHGADPMLAKERLVRHRDRYRDDPEYDYSADLIEDGDDDMVAPASETELIQLCDEWQ